MLSLTDGDWCGAVTSPVSEEQSVLCARARERESKRESERESRLLTKVRFQKCRFRHHCLSVARFTAEGSSREAVEAELDGTGGEGRGGGTVT